MESKKLFEDLNILLVDEDDGFLAKVRSLGEFDMNQFFKIIGLINKIPDVIDTNDCLIIKRNHLDALISLMPVLYDAHGSLIDIETKNQVEQGISELSTALVNALYD